MFNRFAGNEVKRVRTGEVSPGLILDFADDGRVIAIEILEDIIDRMAVRARAA